MRALFGSASYAASRISRWRKRNPSSPATCVRSGLISSLRTSAASTGVTDGSSGESAWTAPRWNTSPSTAARSSTRRSAGSSLSRRAASTARSVEGTITSPAPSDTASISSMNSGFPPAVSAILPPSSSGTRSAINSTTWASSSGPSLSATGQLGLSSVSSGRATQSRTIGLPVDSNATCSTRSRNVCSPHWMSSKTTTNGSSAAALSSVLRNAHAISSADVGSWLSPSRDRIAATAVSSAGRTSSCFNTSTTGQYVIPSP